MRKQFYLQFPTSGKVRRMDFQTPTFVYPMHLNPNVRKPVFEHLGGQHNVNLIEPLSYLSFVYLMDKATLILTDSGVVQEEAPQPW